MMESQTNLEIFLQKYLMKIDRDWYSGLNGSGLVEVVECHCCRQIRIQLFASCPEKQSNIS